MDVVTSTAEFASTPFFIGDDEKTWSKLKALERQERELQDEIELLEKQPAPKESVDSKKERLKIIKKAREAVVLFLESENRRVQHGIVSQPFHLLSQNREVVPALGNNHDNLLEKMELLELDFLSTDKAFFGFVPEESWGRIQRLSLVIFTTVLEEKSMIQRHPFFNIAAAGLTYLETEEVQAKKEWLVEINDVLAELEIKPSDDVTPERVFKISDAFLKKHELDSSALGLAIQLSDGSLPVERSSLKKTVSIYEIGDNFVRVDSVALEFTPEEHANQLIMSLQLQSSILKTFALERIEQSFVRSLENISSEDLSGILAQERQCFANVRCFDELSDLMSFFSQGPGRVGLDILSRLSQFENDGLWSAADREAIVYKLAQQYLQSLSLLIKNVLRERYEQLELAEEDDLEKKIKSELDHKEHEIAQIEKAIEEGAGAIEEYKGRIEDLIQKIKAADAEYQAELTRSQEQQVQLEALMAQKERELERLKADELEAIKKEGDELVRVQKTIAAIAQLQQEAAKLELSMEASRVETGALEKKLAELKHEEEEWLKQSEQFERQREVFDKRLKGLLAVNCFVTGVVQKMQEDSALTVEWKKNVFKTINTMGDQLTAAQLYHFLVSLDIFKVFKSEGLENFLTEANSHFQSLAKFLLYVTDKVEISLNIKTGVFLCKGFNLSYKACYKEMVESINEYLESRGLFIEDGKLKAHNEKWRFSDLSDKLKKLIEEYVQAEKRPDTSFDRDAVPTWSCLEKADNSLVEIINSLNIPYEAVLSSLVRSLQLLASNNIVVEYDINLLGIHLNLIAQKDILLKENCRITTSASSTPEYHFKKGRDGCEQRGSGKAAGLSGEHGLNGFAGNNAGDITVSAGRKLVNFETLRCIAIGGKGGDGQAGGDGDDGQEGKSTPDAIADETGYMRSQSVLAKARIPGVGVDKTILWSEISGDGGLGGKAGRGGEGGYAGNILIEDEARSLKITDEIAETIGVSINELDFQFKTDNGDTGVDGAEISHGGSAGSAGYHGFDQQRVKYGFFYTTTTEKGLFDERDYAANRGSLGKALYWVPLVNIAKGFMDLFGAAEHVATTTFKQGYSRQYFITGRYIEATKLASQDKQRSSHEQSVGKNRAEEKKFGKFDVARRNKARPKESIANQLAQKSFLLKQASQSTNYRSQQDITKPIEQECNRVCREDKKTEADQLSHQSSRSIQQVSLQQKKALLAESKQSEVGLGERQESLKKHLQGLNQERSSIDLEGTTKARIALNQKTSAFKEENDFLEDRKSELFQGGREIEAHYRHSNEVLHLKRSQQAKLLGLAEQDQLGLERTNEMLQQECLELKERLEQTKQVKKSEREALIKEMRIVSSHEQQHSPLSQHVTQVGVETKSRSNKSIERATTLFALQSSSEWKTEQEYLADLNDSFKKISMKEVKRPFEQWKEISLLTTEALQSSASLLEQYSDFFWKWLTAKPVLKKDELKKLWEVLLQAGVKFHEVFQRHSYLNQCFSYVVWALRTFSFNLLMDECNKKEDHPHHKKIKKQIQRGLDAIFYPTEYSDSANALEILKFSAHLYPFLLEHHEIQSVQFIVESMPPIYQESEGEVSLAQIKLVLSNIATDIGFKDKEKPKEIDALYFSIITHFVLDKIKREKQLSTISYEEVKRGSAGKSYHELSNEASKKLESILTGRIGLKSVAKSEKHSILRRLTAFCEQEIDGLGLQPAVNIKKSPTSSPPKSNSPELQNESIVCELKLACLAQLNKSLEDFKKVALEKNNKFNDIKELAEQFNSFSRIPADPHEQDRRREFIKFLIYKAISLNITINPKDKPDDLIDKINEVAFKNLSNNSIFDFLSWQNMESLSCLAILSEQAKAFPNNLEKLFLAWQDVMELFIAVSISPLDYSEEAKGWLKAFVGGTKELFNSILFRSIAHQKELFSYPDLLGGLEKTRLMTELAQALQVAAYSQRMYQDVVELQRKVELEHPRNKWSKTLNNFEVGLLEPLIAEDGLLSLMVSMEDTDAIKRFSGEVEKTLSLENITANPSQCVENFSQIIEQHRKQLFKGKSVLEKVQNLFKLLTEDRAQDSLTFHKLSFIFSQEKFNHHDLDEVSDLLLASKKITYASDSHFKRIIGLLLDQYIEAEPSLKPIRELMNTNPVMALKSARHLRVQNQGLVSFSKILEIEELNLGAFLKRRLVGAALGESREKQMLSLLTILLSFQKELWRNQIYNHFTEILDRLDVVAENSNSPVEAEKFVFELCLAYVQDTLSELTMAPGLKERFFVYIKNLTSQRDLIPVGDSWGGVLKKLLRLSKLFSEPKKTSLMLSETLPKLGLEDQINFLTPEEQLFLKYIQKTPQDIASLKPQEWLNELKQEYWEKNISEKFFIIFKNKYEQYFSSPACENIIKIIYTSSYDELISLSRDFLKEFDRTLYNHAPEGLRADVVSLFQCKFYLFTTLNYSRALSEKTELPWFSFIEELMSLSSLSLIEKTLDLASTMAASNNALVLDKVVALIGKEGGVSKNNYESLEHFLVIENIRLITRKLGFFTEDTAANNYLLLSDPVFSSAVGLQFLKTFSNALSSVFSGAGSLISVSFLNAILDAAIDLNVYADPDLVKRLEVESICYWMIVLRRQQLGRRLRLNLNNTEHREFIDLLVQFKKIYGDELVDEWLQLLEKKDNIKNFSILQAIFKNFYTQDWTFDREALSVITKGDRIADWDSILSRHFLARRDNDEKERAVTDLEALMRNDQSTIGILMQPIIPKNLISLATAAKKLYQEKYSKLDQEGIANFAKKFKQSGDGVFPESEVELTQFLALMYRAVQVAYGQMLRDTQLTAIIFYIFGLERDRGLLGNIYTGEGKTLITCMLAIACALRGEQVDVITSSRALAEPQAKQAEKLCECFGISVSNNCDLECEKNEGERKQRYGKNKIIFGDLASFQRDYLITKYFDREIRTNFADRLILDEVDNMLVDNTDKVLYISHPIHDLACLKGLFLLIWKEIVLSSDGQDYSEKQVKKIYEAYQRARKNGDLIISGNYLDSFIDRRFKTWVENAYYANRLEPGKEYSLLKQGEFSNQAIIMDLQTGVEQFNSQWNNGLHQFIQLKHGQYPTDESLRAIFISNVSYFKHFTGRIFGMSGTLEAKLLQKVYEVDLFKLPRFKKEKYRQLPGKVVLGNQQWEGAVLGEIQSRVSENKDKQPDEAKTQKAASIVIEQDKKIVTLEIAQEDILNKIHGLEKEAKILKEKIGGLTDRLKSWVGMKDQSVLQEREIDESALTVNRLTLKELQKELAENKKQKNEAQLCRNNAQATAHARTGRAVLVICKDQKSAQKIHQLVTKDFFQDLKECRRRIYLYDSYLNEFNVGYLQPGDIIIATNIAGRGTDLELSDLLVAQGGLHVVLTHLPNAREEEQAFRRAARKGQPGSGCFILEDPRENVSIELLCDERDELEELRLNEIEFKKIPKLLLEEALFDEFSKVQQKIKETLEQEGLLTPELISLQIKSLQDSWAFWLDQQESVIEKAHAGGRERVLESFSEFASTAKEKANKKEKDSLPEKMREAYWYLKNKQFYEAEKRYSLITDLDFNGDKDVFKKIGGSAYNVSCSGFPYYYQAMAILSQSSSEQNKKNARSLLKIAIQFFEKKLKELSVHQVWYQQIVCIANRRDNEEAKKPGADLYTQYQIDDAGVIAIHLDAAKTMVGKPLSEDLFVDGEFKNQGDSEKLFKNLLEAFADPEKDCWHIKNYRFSAKLSIRNEGGQDCLFYNGKKVVFSAHNSDYQAEVIKLLKDKDLLGLVENNEQKVVRAKNRKVDVTQENILGVEKTGSITPFWEALVNLGLVKSSRTHFPLFSDSKNDVDAEKEKIKESVNNNIEDLLKDFEEISKKTESERKQAIERISKRICDVLISGAGSIREFSKLEFRDRYLTDFFKDQKKLPPAVMKYMEEWCGLVLEIGESKGWVFWQTFWCAMLGAAQIMAGALLVAMVPGLGVYCGKVLINEGIGDICYAVQSACKGEFTWSAYGQQKIISTISSVIAVGVTQKLAKAAEAASLVQSLASAGIDIVAEVAINVGLSGLISHVVKFIVDQCKEQLASVLMTSAAKDEFTKMQQHIKDLHEKLGVSDAAVMIQRAFEEVDINQTIQFFCDPIILQASHSLTGALAGFRSQNSQFWIKLLTQGPKIATIAFDYLKHISEVLVCPSMVLKKINEILEAHCKREKKRDTVQLAEANVTHLVDTKSHEIKIKIFTQVEERVVQLVTNSLTSTVSCLLKPQIDKGKAKINALLSKTANNIKSPQTSNPSEATSSDVTADNVGLKKTEQHIMSHETTFTSETTRVDMEAKTIQIMSIEKWIPVSGTFCIQPSKVAIFRDGQLKVLSRLNCSGPDFMISLQSFYPSSEPGFVNLITKLGFTDQDLNYSALKEFFKEIEGEIYSRNSIFLAQCSKHIGHMDDQKGYDGVSNTDLPGGYRIFSETEGVPEILLDGMENTKAVSLTGNYHYLVSAMKLYARCQKLAVEIDPDKLEKLKKSVFLLLPLWQMSKKMYECSTGILNTAQDISMQASNLLTKVGDQCVLPAGWCGHAIYISVTKQGSGYDIVVYNAGEGLSSYHYYDQHTVYPFPNKIQNLDVYVKTVIQADLKKMEDVITDVYGKPAQVKDSHPNAYRPKIGEASNWQKVGNCAYYNLNLAMEALIGKSDELAFCKYERDVMVALMAETKNETLKLVHNLPQTSWQGGFFNKEVRHDSTVSNVALKN